MEKLTKREKIMLGKHASIEYELTKLYKLEELIENDEDIYAK